MARGKLIEILAAGLLDSNGDPLAAGKVYTYEPGTSTDKDTYTDAALTTAAANPIILDAAGRANVYGNGLYKLDVDDSADADVLEIDNYSAQVADGRTYWGGTTGGSSNAYTATPSPSSANYTAGDRIVIKANHTNSGASTLNVSSLGTKNIRKDDGATALASGDIVQDNLYELVYDGTQWILIAPSTSSSALFNTTSGSSTAYTLSISSSITAYYTGLKVDFIAHTISGASPTLNVNSIGAVSLKDVNGNALVANQLDTNGVHTAIYDGSDFIVINPVRVLNLAVAGHSELTVSSGEITVTATYHSVDTESDAATDDLGTINGGTEGDIIILRADTTGRKVTLKHGTGNIYLDGQVDYELGHPRDHCVLLYTGASWSEIGRGNNNAS